jgi:hypothetical protein
MKVFSSRYVVRSSGYLKSRDCAWETGKFVEPGIGRLRSLSARVIERQLMERYKKEEARDALIARAKCIEAKWKEEERQKRSSASVEKVVATGYLKVPCLI